MAITTVHNELIAVNAISGTAIADNAVTSIHIAKNNIGTVQIAQNSVTSVSIALNQVTGTQIANNAITSTQLADNAVTATKIPDGTQLALGATNFSGEIHVGGTSVAAGTATLMSDGHIKGVLSSGGSGDTLIGAISGVSNGHQIIVDSSNNQTYKWFNGGTNSMIIDSSGKVGIGTTSPTQKLDVVSTSAGNTTIPLVVRNSGSTSTGTEAKLFLSTVADDARGAFVSAIITDSSNGNALLLGTNTAGASPVERMRIDSSGKVGIGDSSPFTKLHVEDTSWSSGAPYGAVAYIQGGAVNDLNWGHLLITQSGTTTDTGGRLSFGANGENPIAGIRTKYKGATYGDLAFLTRPSGGTNTERMVIDSSGKVGIGVTPSHTLHVHSDDAKGVLLERDSGSNPANLNEYSTHYSLSILNRTSGSYLNFGGSGDYSSLQATDGAGTATAKIISLNPHGGNVGIGDTVPDYKLVVKGAAATNSNIFKIEDSAGTKMASMEQDSSGNGRWIICDTDGNADILLHTAGTSNLGGGAVAIFGGTLYVSGEGATFSPGSHNGMQLAINGQSVSSRAATNLQTHKSFYNPNGSVGTIKTTGSATQFNTSSDYRLKENIVTDWDGTTLLKQLKPSKFNFKADTDTTVQGFLAHEVSSIVPQAVSGEKDAVYTAEEAADGEGVEGQPNYQGIDQSKLVPLLVKTIQELEARIATLEG